MTRPCGPRFLRHFPNTAFSIVLGLAGNSVLWKSMRMASFIEAPAAINWFFWIAAIAVWVCFTMMFIAKGFHHPDMVRKEWHDNVRGNFFQAPNFAIVILCLSTPMDVEDLTALRVIYVITLAYQMFVSLLFYQRWMFTDASLGTSATTPYLLNVVGWFLLTNLAQQVKVKDFVGVDLAIFSFGIGVLFTTLVYVSVFSNLHHAKVSQGHPALFLLIAPPSIACLSMQGLLGGWTMACQATFGAMIFMLMLLLQSSITDLKAPGFLGVYWAYVFPLAALATASIANANAEPTLAARCLSWVLIGVSQIALLGVLVRMMFYHYRALIGKAVWNDPLVPDISPPPSTEGKEDSKDFV